MNEENVVATPSFTSFGKTFQERLAFLILEDRVFSDRMLEVLNIEFFELKYLQVFTDRIFDYKNKFRTHPSREAIEILLRTSLEKENDILKKQIRDFYAKMVSESNIGDSEFIKTESLDFCRKQKLAEAMIKSSSLIKTNSFDEISKVINNALKAGAEIDNGHDYIKDFEKRYVENVRNPIPTGWDKIDELIGGGIGRKEYAIVLASSGGGKSMILTHVAANALKLGHNVIFYTLELSPEVIGLRFDACLTGIPIDELKDNKKDVISDIQKIEGNLTIKHFAKKSASMVTVRNHISRMKNQGFVPDLIVLDYLDLLKPSKVRQELRHEIGETYDEFETMCQEENVAGFSASQVNRSAYNSSVITLEQTSEALNKNFGCYLTLGLSRTQEDKVKNTGRLTICKNRNGPDGMSFNIFMDAATVDIKVIDDYDPKQNVVSLVNEEETKRRMRVKYEKFKNGGAI